MCTNCNKYVYIHTERYKSLPSLPHRAEFVDLQLDLLEDFRLRIVQIKAAMTESPLDKYYIAILNAAEYISTVLREWTELPVSIV